MYPPPSLSLSVPPLSLDTADKAEASLMLHSISELREHQPEEKSGAYSAGGQGNLCQT